MQGGSPVVSLSPSSPSFNSYSSANLAEIAARVVEEFRQESNGFDSDMFGWEQEDHHHHQDQRDIINNHGSNEEDEEEDFEFAVVVNNNNNNQDLLISADDIFFNGQIKPFYPLFDTSLLSNESDDVRVRPRTRSPLGKLMSEERETDVSLSCSSSEADDLESLQPGTYCVWTPKASKESPAPGRCKKSNSTGTSKRWNKFRELLLPRSNSDGKDTFVFLTRPSHNNINNNNNNNNNNNHHRSLIKAKEEDKKMSILPYKQDLVAFLSNVNGFSRR